MKYTAASIAAELKRVGQERGFGYDGLDSLVCPATHILLEDGDGNKRECNDTRPMACHIGQEQKCKRMVRIYNNKSMTRLYTPLIFTFTISATNRDGFIETGDNLLGKLIDRGDIQISRLTKV